MSSIAPRSGTIQEAATAYGVSPQTIRRWIRSGILEAHRIGPRLIRVNFESLARTALNEPGAAND
jgi:excisionase family DNA binding protein